MAAVNVNKEAILNILGVIAEKRQLLYDSKVILESNLKKINSNWESNGVDKQSYVLELEKQVKRIENLIISLEQLKNDVLRYLEDINC